MPFYGLGCITEPALPGACPVCGSTNNEDFDPLDVERTKNGKINLDCCHCQFQYEGNPEYMAEQAEDYGRKTEFGQTPLIWQFRDNNTDRLLNDSVNATGNGLGSLCRHGATFVGADGQEGVAWLTGKLDELQAILNDYERLKAAEKDQKKRA